MVEETPSIDSDLTGVTTHDNEPILKVLELISLVISVNVDRRASSATATVWLRRQPLSLVNPILIKQALTFFFAWQNSAAISNYNNLNCIRRSL